MAEVDAPPLDSYEGKEDDAVDHGFSPEPLSGNSNPRCFNMKSRSISRDDLVK